MFCFCGFFATLVCGVFAGFINFFCFIISFVGIFSFYFLILAIFIA